MSVVTFLIGLVIGGCVGFFGAALCATSAKADKRSEEDAQRMDQRKK